MTGLGDFNSYDLGRVLEALRAEVAVRPDNFPGPVLRAAFVQLVTWDHSRRTCWDDPSFLARYTWLRETLRLDTHPTLDDVVLAVSGLVRDLMALDEPDDETPF